jgi:hypothetical protein
MVQVLLEKVIQSSKYINKRNLKNLIDKLGTTAKLVASKLGFGYIDTGAMFRAVNKTIFKTHTPTYTYTRWKAQLS